MRKAKLLPVLLLLLPFISFSQLLKGRVLDERGDDAAGVTVSFQNKSNRIITNRDGTFKIMATRLPDTLVFSSPAMETYKVVITEKNIKDPNFEVVMLDTRKGLSEVVVTSLGGTRSRREMSYDKSSLSGRVPGLAVRGTSSYSDSYAPSPEMTAGRFIFTDTNIARDAAPAKSRLLTAGQVNDFNKWKMWEDYTANEFASMSQFWGMRTSKRFSVQLTGKNHNAVINEPVYLIHKISKDTVWKAYTDNTGKAELWAGFFGDGLAAAKINSADYFISDAGHHTISNPSEFANGVNLMVVDRSCNVTYDADIAFVVDATGSMGDEIEFLKLELEDVIRHTMDKYRSLTLRAASVFYRDTRDDYLTKKVSFSDDLLKTLNFIKLQEAAGGGDYPEAVDEALSVALDSIQWNKNARTRLLFLVLDAPPHNEAKERIQQLTAKAAAMGIRIIPVACSGTDKSTEFLLRSMALATNGTYTFLTDHSGVGNGHIEPTTDKYEVELLNSLLQNIIGQYLYAKDCSKQEAEEQTIKQPSNILSVKIYPNPASGQFTIESKADLKEIYITDFTGKILMRLPVTDKKGRWQVDISAYPSGAYLVKYITTDNKWGAEKVILVR